jgi:Lon protease-like protein
MTPHPFSPDEFSGTARLFPLPDLVLFPHAAQPLHVFEPRYRQLTADALAGDRLVTMALLRPGWEEDYHNSPPIHPVVCVGGVVQEERLPDGRYHLLLQGLSRARVIQELATDRPYRVARVELLADVPVADPASEEALRAELGDRVLPFFSAHPPAREQLRRLVQGSTPLGGLCDVLCFALPLGTEARQELLSEVRVEPRVRLLLRRLEGRTPPAPRGAYPPPFSEN